MEWEELAEEFRALGGVLENVRLGSGAYGRGLFVIDPAREAIVHLPERLMVPVDATGYVNGALVASRDRVPADIADFFDRYHRNFGWSVERHACERVQRSWHELPAEVVTALHQLGVVDKPDRFDAPAEDVVLRDFLNSRAGRFGTSRSLIPVLDLVNHRATAAPYRSENGLTVSGRFDDEVFVRYNSWDSIACALTYSFPDRSVFANSIAITVDIPRGRQLSIARSIGDTRPEGNVTVPKIEERGSRIEIAYMLLGCLTAPDAPRAIFRHVMKPYVTLEESDVIFDSIAHFNRTRFIDFLRLLERYEGGLISVLKAASLNQLEGLSACIGARTL